MLPAALLLLGGCGEDPPPETAGAPPPGAHAPVMRTSDLVAGPRRPEPPVANPYEGSTAALDDGERYYGWFNCAGCHGGAGGGGIGPPLADRDWIYGGEPAAVFQSIVQGRPNGMPSFGGQIADEQVWKLVAYVHSLSEESGGERAESGSVEGRPQDRRAEAGGGDAP